MKAYYTRDFVLQKYRAGLQKFCPTYKHIFIQSLYVTMNVSAATYYDDSIFKRWFFFVVLQFSYSSLKMHNHLIRIHYTFCLILWPTFLVKIIIKIRDEHFGCCTVIQTNIGGNAAMGATTGGRGSEFPLNLDGPPNFLHSFLMNRVWLCNRLHQTA